MSGSDGTIVALDVGDARVGVAVAHVAARIASPYKTLIHNDAIVDAILRVIDEQRALGIVVGLPRNLNGDYTNQTHKVEAFVTELEKHLQVPLYWQDEAATSIKAEAELKTRKKPYTKGDVDALAATYILDDFLRDNVHTVESWG